MDVISTLSDTPLPWWELIQVQIKRLRPINSSGWYQPS